MNLAQLVGELRMQAEVAIAAVPGNPSGVRAKGIAARIRKVLQEAEEPLSVADIWRRIDDPLVTRIQVTTNIPQIKDAIRTGERGHYRYIIHAPG